MCWMCWIISTLTICFLLFTEVLSLTSVIQQIVTLSVSPLALPRLDLLPEHNPTLQLLHRIIVANQSSQIAGPVAGRCLHRPPPRFEPETPSPRDPRCTWLWRNRCITVYFLHPRSAQGRGLGSYWYRVIPLLRDNTRLCLTGYSIIALLVERRRGASTVWFEAASK